MHRPFALVVFLAVLPAMASSAALAQSSSHPTVLIRCAVITPQVEALLRSMSHVEVLRQSSPTELKALVYQTDLQYLTRLAIPFEVVHPDIEAYFASRLTDSGPLDLKRGSMGGYMTWQEVGAKLDEWRKTYPKLITARTSIGKTLENRDQWIVKISDNADIDENEPEVFVETLIHAREPAGLMSMMRCVEYLLQNYGKDPVVTDLVDNREIWYCPVMNADGYEYNRTIRPKGGGMWRKNRRVIGSITYGVDLNRNWGYQWGYDNIGSSPTPSSTTYRGTAAFSEPESANVRNFIQSRTSNGMVAAWDIHCHGALCMWPYSYKSTLSARHAVYTEISADMVAENHYRTGAAGASLYLFNGSAVDWFEGGGGLWAWTPEIGHSSPDNFWPPTARILALTEENLHMLFTGLKYAGPYLIVKAQTLKELGNNNGQFEAGEKVEVTVTVRNRGVVTAQSVKAKLVAASDFVTIEVGSVDLGSVPTVTDANNSARPLRAAIKAATPPGQDLHLSLVLEFSGHRLTFPLDIIAGPGTVLVNDTCESPGWAAGVTGDTAVRGKWTWGDPNATYATANRKFLVQSGNDHTAGSGSKCYVTGNQSTSNGDSDDVDGGKTTLMTPALDLSTAFDPRVEYWRWYMDHGPEPNNDAFVVSVSDDDGATWTEVERVTYQHQNWRRHAFRLRDFVRPTARVRLRFVATDAPDDSYCEALIDDLKVTDYDAGIRFTLGGSTKIGQTALLNLTALRSPSKTFVMAAAFGDWSGFRIPGPRSVPLNLDPLFFATWSLPGIFQGFTGTLSAAGAAQAKIAIPDNGALVGVTVYTAFLTLDATAPGGVLDVSWSLPITFAAK